MVWGAMSRRGTVARFSVTTRMDSGVYIAVLENYLWDKAEQIYPNGYILQQDGAIPHTSKATSD